MANEYKLSYTATEIDEKLGKIDNAVFYTQQTLTDEQKAQARTNIGVMGEADNINFISTELAKRGQLKPEFANSVDECTDTAKLYVLPDGMIWAYMTKTVTVNPTNWLKNAIGSDGKPFNGGTGYKAGYRLNSSGAETALETMSVTGFMPVKYGNVLRFSGIEAYGASSNAKIAFYNSSYTFLGCEQGDNAINAFSNGIYTVNNSSIFSVGTDNIAYFRLSVKTISSASIVTVNEPLEASTTTTQGWNNTGHAFVPADYEERVIDLETRTTSLEEKTASLEEKVDELSIGDVSTYIAEEAKRVADTVQANRTVGSLTFTAMSDLHVEVDTEVTYGIKNNLTSCHDAGLGLSELQKHLKLDFAAMLGDYTWGDSTETIEQVKKDITYVKKCMTDGMKGIPNIWVTGNHDINYGANTDRRMTEDELFAYVTCNNTGTTQDCNNIGRNYGYIDFENQRIRCIYLNTVDALDYPDNTGAQDDASEVTAVQTQWLVDVGLNLTDKAKPTDWHIVVLSHHSINIFSHVLQVLEAYKNGAGGSVSVTTNGVATVVNYNFASVSRGVIVANIHGHNHNFSTKKIGISEEWLWRVCVPNIDTTRENEAATSDDTDWAQKFGEFDANGNPVYYKKTQGTAESTSFNVITIDRKNRKIHAIAYGAGYDREIGY